MSAAQQIAWQCQPAGDFQGVAHAELADLQPIGRLQGLDIELDSGVLGVIVVESIGLQIAEMRGDQRQAADAVELVEDGATQGGAFGRVGAGAEFIE